MALTRSTRAQQHQHLGLAHGGQPRTRYVARFASGVLFAACLSLLGACSGSANRTPLLAEIYDVPAQRVGAARNPVVVIPGILGSRLVDDDSGRVIWGAFTYGAVDPDFGSGARLFALPMSEGVPLAALTDHARPDGVLESLEANVGLLRVTALRPYRGIIVALDAGNYIDRDIAAFRQRAKGRSPVDYAGLHYTCFQLDYDWRRDISEQVVRLDTLIQTAAQAAQRARGTTEPVRVDIVAHSMGGKLLQYYLRYGTQPLPEDGSLPTLNWAGARNVENAVFVGTPNAGSIRSLVQLIEGVNYSAITPTYRPAIIGTMPSLYQLLPRPRHARVVDDQGVALDLYDAAVWEKFGWGLADPRQDRFLHWLLPQVPDAAGRRRVAIDHLRKCLARAEQLHRALDIPGEGPNAPPEHLDLTIVLGDSIPTGSVVRVAPNGRVQVAQNAPGDGTVTRASALMDERVADKPEAFRPFLRSPIPWDHVTFISADHIELTDRPEFLNAILYTLLEKPRPVPRPNP